jgi:Beta-lactamase
MSYARFVQDNILVPLGMKSSGYDSSAQKLPKHATGYVPTPDGPLVARYIDMTIPYSAGALYSTTEDLQRWEQGLYGGKLLKPTSLQKMMTPFKNNYGFGLRIEPDSQGGKVISHSGGIEGFNTRVVYVTTDKLIVVVLANLNGDAADHIANDLRKVAEGEAVTLLSDRTAVALPAGTLDRLTGHYATDDGALLTISRKNHHLSVAEGAGTTREWYPQDSNNFFTRTENLQIAFEEDLHGQVDGLIITQSTLRVTATRISEEEAQRRFDALAEKVGNQTPTSGSDAAVRRQILARRATAGSGEESNSPL